MNQELVERAGDRLLRDDLFTGWRVRPLSLKHPAYNPYRYPEARFGRRQASLAFPLVNEQLIDSAGSRTEVDDGRIDPHVD